jgi:hypothetical protein
MRARLKRLTSDEIPDLKAFVPAVPDEFAVPLVLEVGALGVPGRERFELLAVTPRWLLKRHGQEGVVVGRGKLLVFEWRYDRIRAFLARKVEACTGRTWPEVARKVSAIAEWEGDEENVVGLNRG